MKKIKEHIVYYYNSYLLSFISIVYGWQLILQPEILQTYRVYQKIRDVFDHRFIGVSFVFLGTIYAIATMLGLKKVRQLTLPVFSFLWTFFSLSFALTEPPNTIWALTFCVALLSFGISLRGDFKDG